jgi:hypothetical protein
MAKRSKNQINNQRIALREALWQSYVTLLRFPIELRPQYINVLMMIRGELAKAIDVGEEHLYEEAEKIAIQLGFIEYANRTSERSIEQTSETPLDK